MSHFCSLFFFITSNVSTLKTCLVVIKVFSGSSQMGMKVIMLINVKISAIVGILIFISTIMTTSESLKAKISFFCIFMIKGNSMLSRVENEKKFIA